MKTVVGLFDSTSDAQRMLEELTQMGFRADDISVVTNQAAQPRTDPWSIHLDAMNLVDVGKIAAAGPLRETLKRSTGSSLALRGALERAGFPTELADRYAAGVERGGTLESLIVPDNEADRVVAAMKRRSTPEEKKTAERFVERQEETRQAEGKERIGIGGAIAGAGATIAAKAASIRGAVGERARGSKEEALAAGREEPLEREATRETATREAVREAPRETAPETTGEATRETAREATGEATRAASAGETYVTRRQESETTASRGLDADEEWRIPVLREELRVGKRAVERGGVRIAVHVVDKPVTEQIHLRESHVEIERRAVNGTLTGDLPAFRDETIEVAELGEESVVSKQARIVEEVVVHKHVTDRVETVQESLRATEVDYDKIDQFNGARSREPKRD